MARHRRGAPCLLLALLSALIAALAGAVTAPRRMPGQDFSALTPLVENAVESIPLDGAVLLVVHNGSVVYGKAFGHYALDTAVNIASGSKWLTAATMMTLVDDGLIGLDDPIGRYLPSFAGDAGRITLRQLLSHTSGLPDYDPSLDDPSITLAECVDRIATGGLESAPGSTFAYGNVSFQVAGGIAEAILHKPWAAIFAERMQGPLDMPATTYGDTRNPFLAGGVVSTARDYGHLLQMLVDNGVYRGRRVLSPYSIDELRRDQTAGLPIAVSLHNDGRHYGLGEWRDIVDAHGSPIQLSSQGDTGFSPWIDVQRHVAGVFLVDDYLGNVYDLVGQIQARVRTVVDSASGRP